LSTPYDVPAPILIETLAQYLKKNTDEVVPPVWSSLVKTGSYTSRPPQNPDWWFTRSASLLRKIYMKGPIGVAHLRSEYGGRKGARVRPEHARVGGGAIVRKALQQLEAAGLVEPSRNRGRVVTKEGKRLLENISTEIKKNMEKKQVELRKH